MVRIIETPTAKTIELCPRITYATIPMPNPSVKRCDDFDIMQAKRIKAKTISPSKSSPGRPAIGSASAEILTGPKSMRRLER